MDYMYGQLYKQIKEIEYKGRNSETTIVTVDQKTRTIKVDVKILSPEQLPKDEGNYVLLVEVDENGKRTLKWVSTQSTLDRIKELEDKTYKLTYDKDTDNSTFDSNVTINKNLNVEGNTTFNNKVTILGKYNEDIDEPLLSVGSESSDTSLKKAFEVLKDGRAKVYAAPKDKDDVVRFEEIDDVYVRRYKAATINERRAYIVKPDGYDYTLPIHVSALGDDLPIRTSNGQLKAADGVEDDDLATVKQLTNTNKALQDNIDKKIDLVEGDATIALKNNSTISYTPSATASTIMQRDSNGRVKVEDGIDNKDAVNKDQLDTKLDLTGGTLTGDLTIQDANVEITKTAEGKGNLTVGGNLRVNGTTTTVDAETLAVKDNLIITNSGNTELVNLSGLAIKTGNKDADENAIAYGILYDPATSADSVKLGLGSINKTTNEFTFKTAADANPVATRDDSTKLTDNHLLVWNSAKHALVDANSLVDSITPASLGLTNFVLDGGEITA